MVVSVDKRVLVVEPGPNNGTIGCGGLIAKHRKLGNEVFMASLTSGDAPTADYEPSQFRTMREKEARSAALVLGVLPANIYFFRHKVFAIDEIRARLELISLIRELRPHVCLIPSPAGEHPDYPATYRAAVTALSFSGGKWFKSKETNPESWAVPRVLIYEVAVPFQSPQYYEDITEHMETKGKALRVHLSQEASRSYKDSSYHLNRFRGIMSRRGEFCEAFQVQVVKADNLFLIRNGEESS